MDARLSAGDPPRPRPARDAALAFTLLTVAPLKTRWERSPRPDIAGWFPLAGALLGALACAVVITGGAVVTAIGPAAAVSEALAGVAWPLAMCVLVAWALATGFLHWDGLADTADGIGGARTHAERRRIMADSATGAIGTAAVVLAALTQAASLATLLDAEQPLSATLALLVAVPVLGRLAATFACWFGVPAAGGGLGASVTGPPRLAGALATVTVLLSCASACYLYAGVVGLAWLLAGVAIAAVVPHVLAGRVGGVTGDVMGASVVLTEAIVLVAATMVVIR